MTHGDMRSPTLSVCCLTRGPTARVATQLQLLRPLADEIVVALDTSVDESLAGPLDDVADVLVRYPYREPVDRPVGWLHSLCTCDWIFWIDDDEIPSARLLRELPEVLAAEDVTHAFVPRQTLWRDTRTVLAEPPWSTDYQLRLVQNEPRLHWFPGITHWPIQAVGPHRYLEAPLFHTDLLLSPLERRRAKVRRYEAAVPGRRVTGLPMNTAYFLPEERPRVTTAAVPAEDAETLDRLFALEPSPEPAPLREPLRLASREEIDAHWRGAPPDEATYRGALTLVTEVESLVAGEKLAITVRAENAGNRSWPWGELGSPRITVSYRWRALSGEIVVADGLRTPLPHTFAPGTSGIVAVDVVAPSEPGRLLLVVDLLHEHVRWFGCSVSTEVLVRPAPRVAVLAADEAHAAEVAGLLGDVSPTIVPVVLAREPAETHARIGYETAPDGWSYLLFSSPRSRLAARARLLRRTAALEGAALLVRGGRRPHLADGAAPFLETLAGADALFVIDGGARERRDRWHRSATMLAARLLGLRVVVFADEARRTPHALSDAAASVLAELEG